MLPPRTRNSWRGVVRMPQMLRTAPITCGQTLSRLKRRSAGIASTMPSDRGRRRTPR